MASNSNFLVGKAVHKDFDGSQFVGKITAFEFPYFQVQYEDDDQEDLSCSEVKAILASELTAEETKEFEGLEARIQEHAENEKKVEEEKKKKEEERKQKAEEKDKSAKEKAEKAEKTDEDTGRPKRGRPPKVKSPVTETSAKKTKTAVADDTIVRTANADGLQYSKCVKHGGVVYVAGQVASDTSDTTVKGQTAQVLHQLDAILAEIGSSKQKLLKCTIFLADISTYDEFAQAWNEWVDKDNMPVRATCEAKCVLPEYLVEVVAEAAV
jgi:enamine deaminase RidA (YjgF/YER057c/UK114 family)